MWSFKHLIKCQWHKNPKVKVSKSQKRFMIYSILSRKDQKNSAVLLWYLRLNCFCSFFWENWRHHKLLLRNTDFHESCFHKFKMLESVLVKVRYVLLYIKSLFFIFWLQSEFLTQKKRFFKKNLMIHWIKVCKTMLRHVISFIIELVEKVNKNSLELKQKCRTGDTFI